MFSQKRLKKSDKEFYFKANLIFNQTYIFFRTYRLKRILLFLTFLIFDFILDRNIKLPLFFITMRKSKKSKLQMLKVNRF